MKVLVVPQGNENVRKVNTHLAQNDVEVEVASSVEQALVVAQQSDHCAIVAVDDKSAGGAHAVDATQLAQQLREGEIETPLLVLASSDDSKRAIEVLDSGADDVISVDTDLGEVSSRLRALSRRCHAVTGTPRSFGELKVDVENRVVTLAGRTIKLTAREFSIIEFLSRRPGVYVTFEQIAEGCWPHGRQPHSNSVNVIVGRIRAKLAAIDDRPYIVTRSREGYCLQSPEATAPVAR